MSVVDPPVCVALDVPSLDEARGVMAELAGLIPMFKVGLELFTAEGPRTVDAVKETGAQVFLDLKVNDIPRTAAAAVRSAGALGASFLTIHGFGGRDMIRAAAEAAAEEDELELLVVTALTSLDDERLAELGVGRGVREQAVAIGRIAAEEGARGLILSPRELDVVRPALPHLLLATPGVRPSGVSVDDHRRALTPTDAILAGADLLVVGRPILEADDRAAAAQELIREVQEAEADREHPRSSAEEVTLADAEGAGLEEEVEA